MQTYQGVTLLLEGKKKQLLSFLELTTYFCHLFRKRDFSCPFGKQSAHSLPGETQHLTEHCHLWWCVSFNGCAPRYFCR